MGQITGFVDGLTTLNTNDNPEITDFDNNGITNLEGAGLISEALVNIDFDNAIGSPTITSLPNSGVGGSSYDLTVRNGTTANLRKHLSGGAIFYGDSGSRITTPDSEAISITGSIDLRCRVSLTDFSRGNSQGVGTKWQSGNRSFFLGFNSLGLLNFRLTATGSNPVSVVSTITPNFENGSLHWIRATWDSVTKEVILYTSETATNDPKKPKWVQLGNSLTINLPRIYDSSGPLEIGASNNGNSTIIGGHVFRFAIYDGIDGTLAADFNPADAGNTGATKFTSAETGEEWTLNNNTYIQNTGHNVGHTIGGTSIRPASPITINDPGTVFLVSRISGAPGTTYYSFDSRSSSAARWVIYNSGSESNFTLYQGSASVIFPDSFDNNPNILVAQFNGNATSTLIKSGSGAVQGNAGPDNWQYGTLFGRFNSSSYYVGYVRQIIVFERQMTDEEINLIQRYLIIENNLPITLTTKTKTTVEPVNGDNT